MPRSRLPWFKMWDELLDSPKIAMLNDKNFRAYIKILCHANRQEERGQFPGTEALVRISGIPGGRVSDLVDAGALGGREGYLVVPRWEYWQVTKEADRKRSAMRSACRELDGDKHGNEMDQSKSKTKSKSRDLNQEQNLPSPITL